MKTLLVQSYLGHNKYFPVYPLGLAYISTALSRKGHEVRIFDPNTSTRPYEELKERILGYSPEVIGISLRNIDNQYRLAPFYYYKHFQRVLETIRAISPNTIIMAGGAGFSMFAEKIMIRNPTIDFGIYLEGEESVPELLDKLDRPASVGGIYFRKNGALSFTGYRALPDFPNFPVPKRDFIDIAPYLNHPESLGIQTVRGCPLKCTYCNYPQLNGNKLRARDAKSVCDEIEYLVRQFNVKQFMFADGVFNAPLRHAEEICKEIIRRGLPVTWSAWMELKHAPKSFLTLAVRAGCTGITFSPDALSQGALNGLQKELEEKDVQDSLNLFIKDRDLRSIHVTYSMFINPPGETLFGLLKTLGFFLKAKLFLRGRGGPFLNWIRLEPETKAFQYAVEKGIFKKDFELLPFDEHGLKNTFFSNPPLNRLDFLIIALLKFIPLMKKIVSPLLGKSSDNFS